MKTKFAPWLLPVLLLAGAPLAQAHPGLHMHGFAAGVLGLLRYHGNFQPVGPPVILEEQILRPVGKQGEVRRGEVLVYRVTPTTAFGAPDVVAQRDRQPVDGVAGVRLAALVEAAWATLDSAEAVAPAELRKGPRGGGRARATLVAHVVAAEHAYARVIGGRRPEPDAADRRSVLALRAAILDVLREPSDGNGLAGKKWPARYAARRIAWHVLDHAWEMEDRTEA